jgi:hypothetical protein
MYSPILSENTTKNSIRELILDTIDNIDIKHGRVLTLPCLNFTLENILSEKLKVHTIEREYDYYNQQLRITKDNRRITNYHSTVLEHLINTNYYYDYAYLDFCGYITKEMVAALALINCSNIALTVLAKREKKRWTKYANNREEMYDRLFKSLGFKILTQIKYNNNGSPMCTYFITKN